MPSISSNKYPTHQLNRVPESHNQLIQINTFLVVSKNSFPKLTTATLRKIKQSREERKVDRNIEQALCKNLNC